MIPNCILCNQGTPHQHSEESLEMENDRLRDVLSDANRQNLAAEAKIRELNLQVAGLQDALENAAYAMRTDDCRGQHENTDCMLCRQIRSFLVKAGRPLKLDTEKKLRICEDCGKQDGTVTRACFKEGRGYLCHDCDR